MKITISRFTCHRCDRRKIHRSPITTGYGLDGRGRKICFACCADIDREFMDRRGRIALYLSSDDDARWVVTNWPGTLCFQPVSVVDGRHNLAGIRRDAWFTDHRGRRWHGIQYGRWSQVLHAKRMFVAGVVCGRGTLASEGE